jgi:hypothetical protein
MTDRIDLIIAATPVHDAAMTNVSAVGAALQAATAMTCELSQ